MDRNRIKMFAAVATAVVVVALGFLLGVQPQLTGASTAREQQAAVEQQNATIVAAIAQLKTDNEALGDLKTELSGLQTEIPSTPALPAFIAQLDSMATASGTVVSDFTAGDAVAYAPEAAAVETPTETQDAAGESTGSSTESAAPTDPAAAGATAPALVTDAAISSSNFSTIPITVTIQGNYTAALDFVSKLQSGDRLFALDAFSSGSSSESGSEASEPDSWTISGNVYVLQDAATAQSDPSATTPTTQAQGTDDSTAAGQ